MSDIIERLRSLYTQNGTDYVQEAAEEIERLRAENDRLTAQITAFKDGWLRVIDTEMVITHTGIAEFDDDYITAKTKLLRLIDWYVSMRTDPVMNGGRQLVPVEPTPERIAAMAAELDTPHAWHHLHHGLRYERGDGDGWWPLYMIVKPEDGAE